MKLSFWDRLLLTVFGLLMLCGAVLLALEAFFGLPVTAFVGQILTFGSLKRVLAFAFMLLMLFTLGVYAVLRPWRRRSKKRGFVLQQSENGEIGISLKAIDSLVRKCMDQHEDIQLYTIGLSESRDGLVIRLRVGMVSGMNIPLAVGALQKQIRQYVTACSGVDVAEVDVQVDDSQREEALASRAVPSLPGALPMEEPHPGDPVVNTPVEMPLSLEIGGDEPEEEEERPLHQRIFGAEEQHVTVPVPPAEVREEESNPEEDAAQEPAETEEAAQPEDGDAFPEPEAADEEAPEEEIPEAVFSEEAQELTEAEDEAEEAEESADEVFEKDSSQTE